MSVAARCHSWVGNGLQGSLPHGMTSRDSMHGSFGQSNPSESIDLLSVRFFTQQYARYRIFYSELFQCMQRTGETAAVGIIYHILYITCLFIPRQLRDLSATSHPWCSTAACALALPASDYGRPRQNFARLCGISRI